MATNLKIDENLLLEAQHVGGFKTKKDTVNEALKSFIRHKKQLSVLQFEGAFPEFDDYDYKSVRKENQWS